MRAGTKWVLLLISSLGLASAIDRSLIGWMGEQPKARDFDSDKLVVLSWHPKIFLAKKLLTDEECDQIIAYAKPLLERSGVADSITGEGKVDEIRTSSGMFFHRGETPFIRAVEKRIAKLTMVPAENGEGMQVLRYEKTQKYSAHHDYFSFEGADKNGGNRLLTVLMYLSSVEQGGETVFPKVPVPPEQTMEAGYSKCAMQGLAYKPSKGDAVVFWSINNDGRFEPASLHASCPVIKGEKWSATKWVHIGRYAIESEGEEEVAVHRVIYVPPPPPALPGCIDKNKLCRHWAEAGECESNPSYMVGAKGRPGDCILACNRCDLGPNT